MTPREIYSILQTNKLPPSYLNIKYTEGIPFQKSTYVIKKEDIKLSKNLIKIPDECKVVLKVLPVFPPSISYVIDKELNREVKDGEEIVISTHLTFLDINFSYNKESIESAKYWINKYFNLFYNPKKSKKDYCFDISVKLPIVENQENQYIQFYNCIVNNVQKDVIKMKDTLQLHLNCEYCRITKENF